MFKETPVKTFKSFDSRNHQVKPLIVKKSTSLKTKTNSSPVEKLLKGVNSRKFFKL